MAHELDERTALPSDPREFCDGWWLDDRSSVEFCWGFVRTWGHIMNTRGIGRGAGRAMVLGNFQSFMCDVEVGWTNPADLEISMEGAAIVELADGGLLVLGGEIARPRLRARSARSTLDPVSDAP